MRSKRWATRKTRSVNSSSLVQKLRLMIIDLINDEDWSSTGADVNGDAHQEGAATFSPRPRIFRIELLH